MKKILCIALCQLFLMSAFAQDWSAVGSGTNGRIHAMIEYDGDLIIGGNFQEAGGQDAFSVARWDGTEWHPMGNGFTGEVYDFAIYGDWLYASGWFSSNPENTQTYQGIARWTGTSWTPLPPYDLDNYGSIIYDMMVHDNELYINNESMVNSESKTRVSKFNGTTWTDLPGSFTHNGNPGYIYSLAVYEGQIVAGGLFDAVDGTTTKSVTIFNGAEWASLNIPSNGLNDKVYKLLEHDGNLYAAGIFFEPFYTVLFKWDGSAWTLYQMDVDHVIWDLEDLFIYDDQLYVSGVFYYPDAGGTNAACSILKETDEGYQWLNLNFYNSNSTQWIGFTMTEYDGALHVGGDFQAAGNEDEPKNNIARFNGIVPSAIYEKPGKFEFLSLGPNPTNHLINLKVNPNQNENYKLMIYNMGGQLVHTETYRNSSVDISRFEAGIYQLMLIGEEINYTGRFVKTND